MAISPLDRKLLRDLDRIKGQALAISLVIGAGVATVVMAIGTYLSLSEIRAAYYERYRFPQVFAHTDRAPLSVADRIAEIDGVAQVAPRIVKQGLLDMPAMVEPVRALLHSVPEGAAPRLNVLFLREGRFIDRNRPDEVLVNEAFAEEHGLKPGDTIGATIDGKRRTLRLVGIALSPEFVYVIGPDDLVPDNRRYAIVWMGREAMEAAFDYEGAFNDIGLTLTRGTDTRAVIDAVDLLLQPYASTGAYDREDHISDSFVRSEMDQMRTMSFILPPIFLGVAAFLLTAVMNRLIETEREQIGLAKAFGYSDREIAMHYLKFVVVVTAVGIVIGSIVGTWMGRGITVLYAENYKFPYLTYVIDARVYLAAAAASLAAALAGAFGSVLRAARLPPAVAMRPPPPPTYSLSLLERMGLTRFLPRLWRMSLRHVTRVPFRSLMASTGIGAAIALLIMSFFFYDAMEEMLGSYFFDTERQDVTLRFAGEKGTDVQYAVHSLPGVSHAEMRRFVGVRLINGPVSERTSIAGLDTDAVLTRLSNADGNAMPVPAEGIVLNQSFADKLGVGVGDRLIMEVLEGRRPVREVEVAAISQSYFGMLAYMNRAALNDLLLEGSIADTAFLRVDQNEENALYAAIKETPAVAGLAVNRAAYEEFRSLIDQTFFTMISFYVGFSMVIAIGVVYNNARIALSERARELASLRVLGFRRNEVAEILLVELGILTLIALPLGCLMGLALVAMIIGFFSTDLYTIPFVITPPTFGIALSVVSTASILAGWIVARRVRHLDLVSVLKSRE